MTSHHHLPAREGPFRAIFWYAFWLAASMIACKSVLLGMPSEISVARILDWVQQLGVMSHADVFFASCVGLMGLTVVRARALGQKKGIVPAGIFAIICLSSEFYSIISVQIFAYLRTPLTYPLIYLAGDLKNMRSSLGAFLTPTMIAALVAGPVVYLVLVWASQRWVRPKVGAWSRVGKPAGLAIVLLYVAWGHYEYTHLPWCDRVDRRIAENPHWVLAKSLFTDLMGEGERIQLAEGFPPGHLDDFKIVADRRVARSDRIQEALRVIPAVHQTGTPSKSGNYEWNSSGKQGSDRSVGDRPMNVIVYVLESVGAQYLSLYGSPYATTPCLEAEAVNSLIFDSFYAHCGVTANSLVAINLGIYPGLTWREYTVEQPNLPGTTLAQLLKPRGYRTAYITSGEIEYVNMDGFLRGRGYDDVLGYGHLPCKELIISWGVEDRCLVEGALQWIDQARGTPFCLMVWTQQTHHPYEPSPSVPFIDFFKGLGKHELPPDDYDLGRYLNVVREADRQLGRLFDGLHRRGLADDTLVVVTGDHGEGFGSPHDIYGHGGRLFDEIVKVPLVLWSPRMFGAGTKGSGVFDRNGPEAALRQRLPTSFCRRADTIGGHIDLNPTLAEMLGLPAAGSWQGRSLFDPGRPPRAYFYAANDDYLLGVREENWKYIYNATIGREQLFDMSRDPAEQTNLAAQSPEQCLSLRQRLAAWLKYEESHIETLRGQSRVAR